MARRNRATQVLAAAASLAFARVTRVLPLSASRALMICFGRIAFWIVPRVRRVGMANLDRAYGDTLTRAGKRRILRGAMDNVALVAAEFSRLPQFAAEKFAGFVEVEGLDHIDAGRGCVCVSGHIGNWEFMAPALAAQGLKVSEVVRPLDVPMLDRYVKRIRESGGIHTIAKQHAGEELLRLIAEGWIAGILMDQCPRDNGIPGAFFGAPCWSTIGPALIAARAQAPLHLVTMVRRPGRSYRLIVHPAVPLEHSESLRKDLLINTQRIQDAFEAVVREYPDQWLWLHRRWKQRPRLQREWEARVALEKE